ncbi:unnamed protein product, partial [Leptidea sinapis]
LLFEPPRTKHSFFFCFLSSPSSIPYPSILTFTCLARLPYDYYHDLHLPHNPPLYPVFRTPPRTQFSCIGRARGTDLCTNGTLFNEQFQVCDHFYNVRCGSPYEDL